jgi:hypothetical protein
MDMRQTMKAYRILARKPLGNERITLIHLREMNCGDGGWMQLTQYCVQWQAFEMIMLNLWVLLPQY